MKIIVDTKSLIHQLQFWMEIQYIIRYNQVIRMSHEAKPRNTTYNVPKFTRPFIQIPWLKHMKSQ